MNETSAKSAFFCPACNKQELSLEKLDFHLTHACSSRSSGKRIKTNEHGEEIQCEHDAIADQSGQSQSKQSSITELFPKSRNLVQCPGCSQRVLAEGLDFHLDKSCSSKSGAFVLRVLSVNEDMQRKPPGLILLTNFVTEDEEARLVSILEANDNWKLSKRNGKCDMKNWGIRIDYAAAKPRTRYPNLDDNEEYLPEFLTFLIKRFEQYPSLSAWWPNEANANRYIKSEDHFLTPHFDDRKLSGDIICNVSLLSDCIMTFRRPGASAAPYRVRLPRLSASIMSRSARFEFTHAIAHEDLLGPKRISINFRQQAEPTGVDQSK